MSGLAVNSSHACSWLGLSFLMERISVACASEKGWRRIAIKPIAWATDGYLYPLVLCLMYTSNSDPACQIGWEAIARRRLGMTTLLLLRSVPGKWSWEYSTDSTRSWRSSGSLGQICGYAGSDEEIRLGIV